MGLTSNFEALFLNFPQKYLRVFLPTSYLAMLYFYRIEHLL